MTDVLYPTDFAGRSRSRSYTKTTLGEPYERGQEPTVILSPLDVLAIQAMAEALNGEDAEYVAPEADPA
jgi:hypothetical protein